MNRWVGQHFLSVQSLTNDHLNELFEAADQCRAAVLNEPSCKESILKCCKGRILGLIFMEPSTRTCSSFSAAMLHLGGTYIVVNESNSSMKKGETLKDTMLCMQSYVDIIALRHPLKGSASEVSLFLNKPLINAGDGAGEHPTQALLDLYSFQREFNGSISGLTITILGDLKYGRTTHSLAILLASYDVNINYVYPEGLEIPSSIVNEVSSIGIAKQNLTSDLNSVLSNTDILYVTRIQKERFNDQKLYEKAQNAYIITRETLTKCQPTIKIFHPLPRNKEICTSLDNLPNAAYFRQAENGMYIRMALIAKLLEFYEQSNPYTFQCLFISYFIFFNMTQTFTYFIGK